MFTSSTIRSGCIWWAVCSPSSPLCAVRTSYPSCVSTNRKLRTNSVSSSTNNMFGAIYKPS
ncbi:MAG: hypothetical protein KA773_09765 [Chloroflexi bacterium]|nr:hypothetical protein [Chloroflexota bacterium]